MTRTVLLLVIGAALGAAAALYFACPQLCKRQIEGKASGFLQGLGLGKGTSDDIVSKVEGWL